MRRAARFFPALAAAVAVLLSAAATVSWAAPPESETRARERRAAVAAPNVKFQIGYDFEHFERTKTTFFEPGFVTDFIVPDRDSHTGSASLSATLPLTHSLGVRGTLRTAYSHLRQSRDQFGSGHDNSDNDTYGIEGELFLRDPQLGSLSIGASFDRTDAPDGLNFNSIGGKVDLRFFFPDLGSGPVDWAAGFRFVNDDLSGPGVEIEVDSDNYVFSAGPTWYLSDTFSTALSVEWDRFETDFASQETTLGKIDLNLLWPTSRRTSLAFRVGASAGALDYKQSPFRGEKSLVWGLSAGVTIRLAPSQKLVELARAYD
ncbi:MAG: hypothetical protein AB8G23_04880 [Myxococcota bacterium]